MMSGKRRRKLYIYTNVNIGSGQRELSGRGTQEEIRRMVGLGEEQGGGRTRRRDVASLRDRRGGGRQGSMRKSRKRGR
jgi:hypothetical protein